MSSENIRKAKVASSPALQSAHQQLMPRFGEEKKKKSARRIYQASEKYDTWCSMNSGFQMIMKELLKNYLMTHRRFAH